MAAAASRASRYCSTPDGDVNLRSGAWYRRRLARHFVNAGGGLFVHRDAPVVMFDLEHG